jgi:hypothetical protein
VRLKIGQHVRIAPAAVAELRPGVEVAGLAAVVVESVDGGRAAERLALLDRDHAARGAVARLGLELPSVFRVRDDLDEAAGNVEVDVVIGRACLQHADGVSFVGGETVGENAAGGARADDHVIEHICTLPLGHGWHRLRGFAAGWSGCDRQADRHGRCRLPD